MKWIKAEDLLAARFHLEKDYPKITPPGVDPEVYMRGWNDALEAAADHAEERYLLSEQFMSDDCISRAEIYRKVAESEELARKRVLDTPTRLPYMHQQNPAFIRYTAQLDERASFKYMIADAPSVSPKPQEEEHGEH